MAKQSGEQGFRRIDAFQEDELKVCDLCSSLNLATNTECFVCGWNGHFENSHDVVHSALIVAIQQHGHVEIENLTDISTYRGAPPSRLPKWRAWLTHMWKWLSG